MKTAPQDPTASRQHERSLSTPSLYNPRAYLLLSALFAAAVYRVYYPGHTFESLPDTYALCAPANSLYTVDDNDRAVDCMVVNRDKVLLLGTQEHIRAQWSIRHPNTPLKLFQTKPGSIIVPGLADAHAHILEWGYKEQLPLADCLSVDDVITKLKQYLHSHPDVLQDPTRWITGMGWDQTKWPTGQFPTADDFDREPLLRGRPIVLSRIDVHAYWVSHSVIEKFSPLPDTVEGGLIIRDSAGNPTGIFVDNAMELVHLPKRSEAEVAESFEITMRDALSVGLTSIHDAWSTPEDIAFYKRLGDDGKLPVRLYLMGATTSDEYWGTQIPRLINYGRDGRLTVRSVKLFTDGALGSWGAALLAPYTDKPETTGLMRSSVSALHDLVEKFYADGWQVNIHAIGDRANKVLLDIFEDILSRPGADVRKWRPRIEHAQIMQPSDLERIGRLGVIASVQPTHATSDMWYAETRLGSERIKGAYAYQSLLQSSSLKILPLGSDFPVEGINPLLGFYAAVSRLSVNGASPNGTAGWYPAEALTRKQALQGMTRDAAYAAFAEAERGILAPGMKADYVVLDRDIMAVPVGEILKTKVLATVIDGRVAYGAI